jgi:hypothetical protein
VIRDYAAELERAYRDAVEAGDFAVAESERITEKLDAMDDPWELNAAIDEARAHMNVLIAKAKAALDKYKLIRRECYLAQPPQA